MEKQTLKIAGASYVSPRAKVVALKARSTILSGSNPIFGVSPWDDDEESLEC